MGRAPGQRRGAGAVKPVGGPLASRNFQLLLTCDVVSTLGTAVALVAIPFAVLSIGGSAADVGYVTAAGMAPVIVFLLLGGVIADRLPQQQVMAGANVLEALAQAGSAALLLSGHAQVWQLMALAALRGTGMGFYFPAASGLLPQTVQAEHRSQANAIDRIGRNVSLISGSALGGVLVGFAGPGWGLAVDAVSYAVAALLRAGMRVPAQPRESAGHMVHELREGWREFSSRRWLWAIVLEFSLLVAIWDGATEVLGPVVAHNQLGGAHSWGIVLAAQSAGAVLGGLVMIRFRPRRMLLIGSLSTAPTSALLFTLAVPLTVPVIAVAAFAAGGLIEVFEVNWATAMQQEIPPDTLSRVSSYDALGSWGLAPVGTAVAGPLAVALGTPVVLAAAGVLIVALTTAVLCVPEVRDLRRQSPVSAQGQRVH
jgi:predicted MFS family arabinose efflux permease